ncbi:MAG: LptF/LptG family permease [Elusimicrobia bacterium]|nr:LptF/LptG family permease [Elusimicrobiota bacterium]
MKIFSWYMAKRFFKPFLYGLGLFAILIFLGDMLNRMNALMRSKASLWIILQYLWLEVPYWTVRVIPMATLLATLVAVTGLIRSGEWIAAQASGFEPRDFWRPLLWCAVAITLISFIAQETVLPACYQRAQRLWQEQIAPRWEYTKKVDFALMCGPGQFIRAKFFFPKDGRMERPILEIVRLSGIERQLDAKLALWDAGLGVWVFYDGVERRFEREAIVEKPFSELRSELAISPRQLATNPKKPEEMSLGELRRHSRLVARLGLPTRPVQVAVHDKIAYPFTNLVICALGIPLAMRLRQAGRVLSFSAALILSFLYLWFIEVGRALGQSGSFPPWVAAWIPNLAFGAVAFWLLNSSEA